MKLYLGVDGGQSGTTAVIGDDGGRILGTGHAGPCNHAAEGEGRAKLERAVTGSVGAACAQAGLDAAAVRFEAACFGMSGGPDDKREILAATLRVERLVVTNDAVISLAGATTTGQGIVTIAGTGSIAFGRNPAGRTARAGGWGYIFGDEGGGVGMDGIIFRPVRETFPVAGGEDFHFTVHDFVGDASEILDFKKLPLAR